MRPLEKIRSYIKNPAESIACILAGGLVGYGLLLIITTLLGVYPIAATSSGTIIYLFASLYTAAGGIFLYQYFNKNLRAGGKMLWVFICYTAMFLSRVSVTFLPANWLAPLICAIVAGLLYIWMSVHARN